MTTATDTAHLESYFSRIEKLEQELKAITDDIDEVFADAKSCGFDVTVMRIAYRHWAASRVRARETEE